MRTDNDLLTHAHDYAERHGWAVIPVRGKVAACDWHRYQTGRPSRKQRGGLFGLPGITGLAVILGEVSGGLRARDFDRAGSYQRWAADHPELALSLPTSRTHRGYHVYFRAELHEGTTYLEDGE